MGQHLLRKAPPKRGEHSQGISYNGVALSSPLHTTVPVLASSGYCLSWVGMQLVIHIQGTQVSTGGFNSPNHP